MTVTMCRDRDVVLVVRQLNMYVPRSTARFAFDNNRADLVVVATIQATHEPLDQLVLERPELAEVSDGLRVIFSGSLTTHSAGSAGTWTTMRIRGTYGSSAGQRRSS
ncbi:MAG TPA: hypothetical protein VGM91_06475 [Conexibacter sp.]